MTHISRTYNISYEMPAAAWEKLWAVYQQLPEFRGRDETGCPTWFGVNGQEKYLWASVESSGLLVEGILDEEEWGCWDLAFRTAATLAFGFKIKDADE